MKLSICIPTYNRDRFLLKNLERIASQIREGHLEKEVEINVSNNGSTDRTKEFVLQFFDQNCDLQTTYRENKVNEGPDANYIQTMHMANGEYSIMLGDDDYFIDGGIKHVLGIINANKDADIFISNRHEIDEDGNFLNTRYYVREDIDDRMFDFSDNNQAGYYLALCNEVGGCMTFISSVVYKTDIIDKIGSYDGSLNGTYYSFWYYWWKTLINGGKLYYIKKPYINSTMQRHNNNFGKGLSRIIVEFKGFASLVQALSINDEMKRSLFSVVNRHFSMPYLADTYVSSNNDEKSELITVLDSCEWSERDLGELKKIVSFKQVVRRLVILTMPFLFNMYIKLRHSNN